MTWLVKREAYHTTRICSSPVSILATSPWHTPPVSDLPEDSCLVLKALLMFLQRLQYLAHLVSSHPISIDSEHGFLSWCCCSGMCCLVFFFRPLESIFSQLQEWNCGVLLDESLELFTKHLVMYVFAELVPESLSLSAVASLLSRSLDETTQYMWVFSQGLVLSLPSLIEEVRKQWQCVVHQKLPEGHSGSFRVAPYWGIEQLDLFLHWPVLAGHQEVHSLPCPHDSSHVFQEIFHPGHWAIHKSRKLFQFPSAGNVSNFLWHCAKCGTYFFRENFAGSCSCNVCKLVWLSFNCHLISSSCSWISVSSTVVSSLLLLILIILMLSVVPNQSSILPMKFKILLTMPNCEWVS